MIQIPTYKQMEYPDFKAALGKAFENCGLPRIQIAANINVNSPATISNALESEEQNVSDKVLTSVMSAVGLYGLVIWIHGKRYYYIKK